MVAPVNVIHFFDEESRYILHIAPLSFGNLLMQQSAHNIDDYCYQHTEQDHGCYGEIKAEIFFFNANITRQVTDPVQFIVKEINNKAYYHHPAADEHQIFAGIGIHKKIILIIAQCFHR